PFSGWRPMPRRSSPATISSSTEVTRRVDDRSTRVIPALHRRRQGGMGMPTERYDILILGSGAGGKLLAWDIASAGHRTAVVERRWIGGSCPNVNCMPSKNEIWSAKVADLVHRAANFGLVTGPYKTNMRQVRQRKREMVEQEVAAHVVRYETSGAELIMGTGRFVAPKTIEVRLNAGGTRVLTGERVFLNVGTRATMPPIS